MVGWKALVVTIPRAGTQSPSRELGRRRGQQQMAGEGKVWELGLTHSNLSFAMHWLHDSGLHLCPSCMEMVICP
jgi:hypothetical protein